MGKTQRWYEGISRYQWLVLTIASLGWIFDVFEGQVFVASMNEAMKSLVPADTPQGRIDWFNNVALGSFLLGGAVGGIFFGALSDVIGRTRTLVLTILMYSLFTCLTATAQSWWHMAGLRFLVAMGVGGEWAVAGAMVAEVFPDRARAWCGALFHASSVFGTYLAVAAGAYVVGNPHLGWRWGFALGALPALLTVWIRWKLRDPEKWKQARQRAVRSGASRPMLELFRREHLRGWLVGVCLSSVGLATFWGVHIYGKDLVRGDAERNYAGQLPDALVENGRPIAMVLESNIDAIEQRLAEADSSTAAEDRLVDLARRIGSPVENNATPQERRELVSTQLQQRFQSIKRWEMLGMLLVTTGGGIGLVCYGPLSDLIGRRYAFLAFHLGGLVSALLLFQLLDRSGTAVLLSVLPLFGFLTLGMHAGYAVYFPELFPTAIRGTGAGFCFNAGRIIAAPILFISGWMRDETGLGLSLETTASLLSLLFLLGCGVVIFAPETRGKQLPD